MAREQILQLFFLCPRTIFAEADWLTLHLEVASALSLRNNLGLQLVALDARHFEVDFVTWWLVVWGWWLIPGGARTSVRRTDSGASASLWANTSDLTEVLFQLHERTSQVFIVSPWFIIFQIIPKARLCGSRTLWTARSPSCCSRVQDAYLWCLVSFA